MRNFFHTTLSSIALLAFASQANAQTDTQLLESGADDIPALQIDKNAQLSDEINANSNSDANIQNELTAVSDTPIVDEALSVIPPLRSAKGKELAQNSEALEQIDIWIKNTDIDNPQNLKLKDILMAMPLSIAGDRLVELAKKTKDPAIQENWTKWLSSYPDAYESVVRAWMKQVEPSSSHFLELLRTYDELNPDDAIDVWTQLVRNFPFVQLGDTASFGLTSPYCESALADQISLTWNNIKKSNPQAPSADTTEILRLIRASSKCRPETGMPAIVKSCENRRKAYANRDDSDSFNGYSEEVTHDLSEVIDQLLNANISRRIAAIDFSAGWQAKQPQIAAIFESAKNTTEKAHALRALHDSCDEKQPERVLKALKEGDEALRLAAASIITEFPKDAFPTEAVEAAFAKEIWPEIQLSLYTVLTRTKTNDKIDWIKAIYLDPQRSENLRLVAMNDLIADDAKNITLESMSTLLKTEAPLELIASTAEHLYTTDTASRPQLRSWIHVQQPFNRRMLVTFARFAMVDAREKDASAIEMMRAICSKAAEQENILRPCLRYMTDNAQTDEDRELADQLQRRMDQYDAMTSLDFGL